MPRLAYENAGGTWISYEEPPTGPLSFDVYHDINNSYDVRLTDGFQLLNADQYED